MRADAGTILEPDQHVRGRFGRETLVDLALIALGTLLTFAVYGYRFGDGNHTIYLLEALRRSDPQLLANDWFTTQTLQYHAVFGWIAQKLLAWNIVQPAFAASYLLLVVLFHAGWLNLARAVRSAQSTYLVALLLYFASAAGTGLGFYQFFQDSSLLPSNVANVALLWGLVLWIRGRFILSGLGFGVAALFHLNFAVVGVGIWVILCLWEGHSAPRAFSPTRTQSNGRGRAMKLGSVTALAPAMINILLAARVKFERSGSMPLAEFIELYVRLRHPHHYDPQSWPIWLWMSFVWPIPFAMLWMRGQRDPGHRRIRHIFLLLLAIQVLALLLAGLWYASEALVQISLYRFSIFLQLFACTAAAAWLVARLGVRARPAVSVTATVVTAGMITMCLLRGPFFGLFVMPEDDAEYRELCSWVRQNTPVDAVFLVPPGESGFRLHARRAIVVNFKAVPQLSAELVRWRNRLQDVLALDDLRSLPRVYSHALRAIDERYAELTEQQLLAVARKYGARFIVTNRPLVQQPDLRLEFSTVNGRYFLYDVKSRQEEQGMSDDQLRRVMVNHFNLRIREHMTRYVQARLMAQDRASEFPVIGGDARTGVAQRRNISRAALARAASQLSS